MKGPLPDGPFKGVPFLIKDISLPVKGWPMTNGSAYLRDHVSTYDAELVQRYRQAGVVLTGKTNTPEFGIPGTTEGRHLGICRNPWNPDHSSGGSSGGAAAAVASGMVPMAHGSDGLGSIRIPAAQCGLVGVKPTQNRNPGGPDDRGRAHGLVVDHVLTRTLRDSAAMLDWTGYPEDDAPYAPIPKSRPYTEEIQTSPGKLRIAFSTEVPRKTPPHPDVQAVFDATLVTLPRRTRPHAGREEGNGHRLAQALSRTGRRLGRHVRGQYRRLDAGSGPRAPPKTTWSRSLWASYRASKKLSSSDIGTGLQNLRFYSRAILALWRDFDVLLSPVTITPPPKIGYLGIPSMSNRANSNKRQGMIFGYTPPYNMTGQPSFSLPLGMSSDRLPIGMMFTGRFGDEATLFRLAAQLEQARPWRDRKPPVWG